MKSNKSNLDETNSFKLSSSLRHCKNAFIGVAIFSAVINILMLAGPMFMLQVYDRVLTSRSVPTLIGLAALVLFLFSVQGVLDGIRARILQRVGRSIDLTLSKRVFETTLLLPISQSGPSDQWQPMRDLDQIRGFFGGAGPAALFDLPWMPLYVFVCFLFHPWIGMAAIVGALGIASIAIAAEFLNRKPSQICARLSGPRNAALETGRRNAETVAAMGMSRALRERWDGINAEYLDSQEKLADCTSCLAALARALRLTIQALVLGLGAFLAIRGEASAGVIIASAILVSRALAPIEGTVGSWKGFIAARVSWKRLQTSLTKVSVPLASLQLPKPERTLSVENVLAVAPGTKRMVVQDVSFGLEAGDGLGIVGPSGSGKSSLARLLVGAWGTVRGSVRLDGAAIDQWSPELLGAHIGYLPQSIELFDGTIAENIARFQTNPKSDDILRASKSAGVHDMIVSLPDGYDTDLGSDGSALSAGQRQRIALARALYGEPFLIVLDEPNSNLDVSGEQALTNAIKSIRDRGGIAIVIAHRPSAIAAVDKVLVLHEGRLKKFGPKDSVLRTGPRPVAPLEGARS